MERLYVFVLRFEDRAALQRAFIVTSDEHAIEGCSVEPEELRIRFLAPKETGAPLLERVYERGGLVWSTRYAAKTASAGA